jgi:hypothetical protein
MQLWQTIVKNDRGEMFKKKSKPFELADIVHPIPSKLALLDLIGLRE